METTLTNAVVVTMDATRRVLAPGHVVIAGDTIVDVGSGPMPVDTTDAIDLHGALIVPGFVNTHHHLAATLLRGLSSRSGLSVAGRSDDRRGALQLANDEAASYAGALLASISLLRSGVTTTTDSQAPFRGLGKCDGSLRAAHDGGLRVVFSPAFVNRTEMVPASFQYDIDSALAELERLRARWSFDKVCVIPEALSLPRATDELVKALHHAGDGKLHMHLTYSEEFVRWAARELGCTAIEHLDRLGVLGPGFLGAHPVYLTDEEVRIYGDRGAAGAYCAVSNMFIGTGHLDLARLRHAGVRMGLGLDHPNHGHDFFETMKMSFVAQNQLRHEGDTVDPAAMLEMATIGGAAALGLEEQIGSLEAGKQADLVVIDASAVELSPPLGVLALLVCAGTPEFVRDVMIAGDWLVRDRSLTHLSEADVLDEARRQQSRVAVRAGLDGVRPVVPDGWTLVSSVDNRSLR